MGYVYLLVWQSFVYWLEFVMYVIGLIVIGLEIVAGVIAAIVFKATE